MLKRISTYCLILVVVLYTTPLQQFLKVPAMLEHFAEHRQQNARITFLDFIFMHYIGDDGVADDDYKDMQLPFKKAGKTSIEAYGYAVIPIPIEYRYQEDRTNYATLINPTLPSPYLDELIKPPQV